jgi:uncharacterized FAD-dependent dehydrogenase
VEHLQESINIAQWGKCNLPNVKAAEYRLATTVVNSQGQQTGVYSFCMCPGGVVVPAAAFEGCNIVNGMSEYARNGLFANAALVAGCNLGNLLGSDTSPEAALDWLEILERKFYEHDSSYKAPAMRVRDFLNVGARCTNLSVTSYPLGLVEADLAAMLPPLIVGALRAGISQFCKSIKGFEEGLLLGLESKTSSPIQVLRHPETLQTNYNNLYVAGEAGGWSGGIASSAADGLRIAQRIASIG